VAGTHSSQDDRRQDADPHKPFDSRASSLPPDATLAHGEPRVVNEFEVRGRGVSLRMRVERWPAPRDGFDDEAPVEAGYGHGV
jgi:hypothetical protein